MTIFFTKTGRTAEKKEQHFALFISEWRLISTNKVGFLRSDLSDASDLEFVLVR